MSGIFGNTGGGTSGAAGAGIFGTSGTPSTSSIFGQATPASSAPATGSLFGGASTGTKPLFGAGSTATQPALNFGSGPGSKPASGASTTSLFGANNSTGNMFGQAPSTTTSAATLGGMFSAVGTSGALGGGGLNFGGGSTPASKPATPQTSLFPGTANTGSNIFGSGLPTTSTTAAGSTTPAGSKQFSFANSTTPAGPPPANGQAKPLFGSAPSGQQPLFGSAKPTDLTQPKAALFPNLGGANSSSTPGANIFGNVSSSLASPAATAPSAAASAPEASKSVLNFPSAANAAGTQTPMSTAAPATTSLFGSVNPSATSASSLFSGVGGAPSTSLATPDSAAAPTSKPTLGGFGGLTNAAPTTSASASAPASKSMFSGLGVPTNSSAPTASSSAAPNTNAPANSNTLSQAAKSTTTQPPSTAGTNAPGTAKATQPLGASVAGPTPQQSRLKNKTMDEIITRWASDLLKYQKEFQEQAIKVASWDRLLVENGEKIQTLSDSTHEAERATREIESQLSTVEGQQAELTSWLDRYEAEVDEMYARQIGPGENLQGPDQERERTYKIAEKLTDRLDEMGKNITSMIDAINDASTNVSKNAKADDPLSHIVRVLNSHLTQLQWIDQNTEILQAKVAAAAKIGQSMSSNGYGGLDNDAAEAFYRSYSRR